MENKIDNNTESTTKETKLPYQQARDTLMEIQGQSGAAIRPFAIYNFFYSYLRESYPSKMNRVKARNIADVYCALLNEFYITNGNDKPHNWFYMTEKRWNKYGLGRKAIFNSVKFLDDNLFIETKIRQHPHKPKNKVKFYIIDLGVLGTIYRFARENNPKNWE